ncbi:MAG: hypothetical protein LBT40_16215 [Deltaproteobacteria bacterium]|jgi:hypothetical protein|nr:hypothetical protein [Deltaproteobacteria bacterium]
MSEKSQSRKKPGEGSVRNEMRRGRKVSRQERGRRRQCQEQNVAGKENFKAGKNQETKISEQNSAKPKVLKIRKIQETETSRSKFYRAGNFNDRKEQGNEEIGK